MTQKQIMKVRISLLVNYGIWSHDWQGGQQ
mgnify:CR=1 FL=1